MRDCTNFRIAKAKVEVRKSGQKWHTYTFICSYRRNEQLGMIRWIIHHPACFRKKDDKMHIMTTIDLKSGYEKNHLNTKSFLAKFANDNVSRFMALGLRKATYLDMQDEIDRLEAEIKVEEICLANASWGGGHSNKLKISTFKTLIINLNAAISAIGAEELLEVSA